MHKTTISIALIIVAISLTIGYLKLEVHRGVKTERQADALATSEANVGIGKEAKEQGEQATKRADKAKEQRTQQINQLKDKMHEKAESYDSIPLSPSDVDLLCRAYRSTDTVCAGSVKSN